ncbi:hypothetical protein [Streptomyces candidus]|uniref:Uncharacterized protein n=1 Tax=Streptomyces candidus TaxID=67283 RepID=A0A7X0LU58_9ACTN|nr:hypothetical protein [Streptomyces candidus]MBB6440114.1 hypothetical protein [Streptomyces candidus]GHH58388.1 hypothetical protein GCM10018773_66540 [Streptomyces candidus]
MTRRTIVSKERPHNGGIARVEMDRADHLFMHCTGCRTEEYRAGMAPALAALALHLDPHALDPE